MLVETIKTTLITAGLLIGIPVVPDWGIQIAIAIIIGLVLPEKIIIPVDSFVKAIFPPATIFEEKLKNNKRLKKILPRIIAGYLFTFIIGMTLIIIGLAL